MKKKIARLLLKCYLDNVLMGLDVMLFKMVWFPISLSHTFYIKIHNKIKYNFMPFPKMLLKKVLCNCLECLRICKDFDYNVLLKTSILPTVPYHLESCLDWCEQHPPPQTRPNKLQHEHTK